jgi:DNA-directed RNA polymerase alpha subunit
LYKAPLVATKKTLRICKTGHEFYKSSDCPTCPVCEKEKKPATGFLAQLSSPARNTLVHHGVATIKKLADHTEKEILQLHGMGKASLPALNKALKKEGLSFRKPTVKKKV